MTLQHPNTPVNVDNVAGLQVGMSANDATFDGLNNWVTITITDKKAVEAIEKGEVKAISMGYKCRDVDNAGVWQGVLLKVSRAIHKMLALLQMASVINATLTAEVIATMIGCGFTTLTLQILAGGMKKMIVKPV